MMTDEELVIRLRGLSKKSRYNPSMYSIAADRIEELLKEREADHENINLKADFIETAIGQSAEDHYKLTRAVEFIQEVRRNGDTRLASMAIAVLAELEK